MRRYSVFLLMVVASPALMGGECAPGGPLPTPTVRVELVNDSDELLSSIWTSSVPASEPSHNTVQPFDVSEHPEVPCASDSAIVWTFDGSTFHGQADPVSVTRGADYQCGDTIRVVHTLAGEVLNIEIFVNGTSTND